MASLWGRQKSFKPGSPLSAHALDLSLSSYVLQYSITGESDVILSPHTLTFLPEQRLLTNISLQFVTDGVARELNETFTITIDLTGVEPGDLDSGATFIPEFTGTIVDVDGMSNQFK